MELKISNGLALDTWINERRRMGRDIASVKGGAPHGATYSDGSLIERPVNVAWKDATTGELFAIEYEVIDHE